MILKKVFFFSLLSFVVLFSFSSCKKSSGVIPQSEQDLPDMILHNATYVYGQPDRKPLVLQASEISVWNKENKTEIKDITFYQGKDGDIELSGTCDRAISYNNNQVLLQGNVKLYKTTDEVNIECDSIKWDDEKQSISTDGIVFLTYQDGTHIQAEGFKALLKEDSYSFGKIIKGRYTSNE